MLAAAARSRVRDRLVDLVAALPLGKMLGLFALHLAFMGAGATMYEAHRVHTGLFNLDGEGRWFALFSAMQLLAGAVLCVLALSAGLAPPSILALGLLLGFMSLDEWFGVHEHLESFFHVDWPVLYSPLMAAGGLVVLVLLRRHRDVRFLPQAFVAGGACWATSVVLEKLQWTDTGHGAHYVAMMIPEELLEATGSFLFAVALALLIRAGARAAHEASRPR
jgi:hypothetical protein